MGGHFEMRKPRLPTWRRRCLPSYDFPEFACDTIRAHRADELELALARRCGTLVSQVHDLALPRPSIAACGASTKLLMPSENQ
jgi:hypothetical protein